MKTPTYQDYEANPAAVLNAVAQAARKERAEAMHHIVVVPLKQLVTRFFSKPVLQHA